MPSRNLKRYSLLLLITFLLAGGYWLASTAVYGPGYPLDDAWIHQTFARNLAVDGEWSYNANNLAAGSTSPLWTVIISIGYRLHINPMLWTVFLGIMCLYLTGFICDRISRQYSICDKKHFIPVFGLLIVSEWHLVWAALSGMETILYILLVCLVFYLLIKKKPSWMLAGLLAGISVWIRPDGLTLYGPILLLAGWTGNGWREKFKQVFIALGPGVIILTLYMLFNFQIDGTIWPNTLYAKQTEYAILREQLLIVRFLRLFGQLQVGAGVVLLPGWLYQCYRVVKHRDKWGIAINLWCIGFIMVYAVQLPVTYQHARYIMPAIPAYLLLGFSGCIHLINLLQSKQERGKLNGLLSKSWLVLVILIPAIFYIQGASAYAEDVAIIETEMVNTAQWISENTPLDATIAGHDIGALGYFGKREILDLAGLIDPEIIPIIRSEKELQKLLVEREVDFLVAFPGWYPSLVLMGDMAYETGGVFSPQAGGENMAVYRLP